MSRAGFGVALKKSIQTDESATTTLVGLGQGFGDHRRLEAAQRAATLGGRLLGDRKVRSVPGLGAWSQARDVPTPPRETFRQWWARTHRDEEATP